MRIEVSNGELIDKITILEIKDERMKDEEKLKNIRHELDVLQKYEFETSLKEDLKQVNNTIWDLEDGIRNLEKVEDFGVDFIDKARNIYKFNDERARIKKLINLEDPHNQVLMIFFRNQNVHTSSLKTVLTVRGP